MVNDIIRKGKKIFFSPQSSVLSAATIIMLMTVVSRVLGLVRQRALAHFFTPNDLSLFFAAFRLPDLIFEVLVFGTFASAFIPVFTKALKKGPREAWEIAETVANIGVIVFIFLAALVAFFSPSLYGLIAPGFSGESRVQIVALTKVLFAAQGFFVISYILTAVLESSRRFIIPAIAPLFYNVGIILGTIFLSPTMGLMGPAIGVAVGAFCHFAVQLPLAIKLGFRFKLIIKITDEVKKIGRLALPRVIEVSFLQIAKSVELSLASIISVASYTFFTFGNTVQLLPVGLFGTSIAKAALPTLARQSEDRPAFKKTLFGALYQIAFLVMPISTVLIVLRIPIVRLIFGTDIFSWESTVQTGMVVSAFALGVFFQAANSVLARSFYALHDTRTPVAVSLITLTINIILDFVLIMVFHLPVWGLAAAFSFGAFLQTIALFILLEKKIGNGEGIKTFYPFFKAFFASLTSGAIMYFFLKFFDRSVWIKELAFMSKIEARTQIPFEKFVLDTRYTVNLLILTFFVIFLGIAVYIGMSALMKSKELRYFVKALGRVAKRNVGAIPDKETETITPTPTDSTPS
jgi:putative peptidoglycan lipid II flippase